MPGPAFEAIRDFFERAQVARRATRPLAADAEVALDLAGGPARFSMEGGRAAVADGPARDPDFTLAIPDQAAARLTGLVGADAGTVGIEFFQLLLDRAPDRRIRVRIHASTARLLGRGYLGVVALGGLSLAVWLVKRGVANPRSAIERLRGR
ncbi:MAG TPA: AAA family ATPase [Anaeromyxobacteraceae bacterium]